MHTEKIHLTDPDFQALHSGKCDLLIRISSFRISYAVIDQARDQLKVLVDVPAATGYKQLEELFQDEELLNSDFHQVKVASDTFQFTFIPADVYLQEQLPVYARFVGGNPGDLTVKDIRSPRIKNISIFEQKLEKLLQQKFISYKLFSTANPFIEASMKFYSGSGKRLLLNFDTGTFEAVVIENSHFLFYNLFRAETTDDFNYFLLLILRELNLDPENLEIIVAGQIDAEDARLQRIRKYFTQIKFADYTLLTHVSETFNGVPPHYFYSLIALNLCE